MKMKERYLSKGVYDHYQSGNFFSVKHYIIVEVEGKRCLLLRFENEMKKTVHAVEFIVRQLDVKGNEIGTSTIKYSGLQVLGGQLYSAEDGIVIENECTDFVVYMKYVICGNTKYVFRKGQITAHYDTRGYGERFFQADKEHKRIVKRAKTVGKGFYGLMTLLSFIIILASLVLAIYRTSDGFSDDAVNDQSTEQETDSLVQQNL